jgi:hypothetical protein
VLGVSLILAKEDTVSPAFLNIVSSIHFWALIVHLQSSFLKNIDGKQPLQTLLTV